jgi:hypothetical protein
MVHINNNTPADGSMPIDSKNKRVNYERLIYNSVATAYKLFCDTFPDWYIDGYTISLNPYTMEDITKRCLKDFERISNHHPSICNPDVHKIAAYTAHMVCKLRPIEILNYAVYGNNYTKALNELMACFSGIALLNVSREKNPIKGKKLIVGSDLDPILKDFIYIMKYCNRSPDLLCIIFYYIDTCKN